jgi:hypothetical protein
MCELSEDAGTLVDEFAKYCGDDYILLHMVWPSGGVLDRLVVTDAQRKWGLTRL